MRGYAIRVIFNVAMVANFVPANPGCKITSSKGTGVKGPGILPAAITDLGYFDNYVKLVCMLSRGEPNTRTRDPAHVIVSRLS